VARLVDPDRELADLRAYLGDTYDHRRLVDWERQTGDELAGVGDEATFYRTSQSYLYDLTAFAMTGTKEPYLAWLRGAVKPGAALLDLGCGIGSDGLALIEAGYRVTFADFDNPSTRYLRWRLKRRDLQAPIVDLDRDALPTGFDLAYSFDVIEHVDDPAAHLDTMERCARLVLVNFLAPEDDENALHHPLDVDALVRRAARMRLRGYDVLHGRSHLVLYESRRARGPRRAASLARVARVRVKSYARGAPRAAP
jgi:SAM-dependent methyltransferase